MSSFDLFGRSSGPRYGTGMWPLYNRRPWNFDPPPGVGAIIDPVAIAQEAAIELRKVGWPGFALMDQEFLLSLLDAPEEAVAASVQNWFDQNRSAVADALESRLSGYRAERVSRSAETGMMEAISAYRDARYLSVVRVLLPEFEAIGRQLVADPAQRTTQAQIIKDLKETLRETPLIKEDPIESMSLFHFVDEQLFAKCFTESDAQAFGGVPNRHAELHGLESYGHLQGASVVLCSMDIVLRFAGRLLDLGRLQSGSEADKV